jgi:hypothetical protein
MINRYGEFIQIRADCTKFETINTDESGSKEYRVNGQTVTQAEFEVIKDKAGKVLNEWPDEVKE